jgi:hypothetical protein
MRRRVRDASGRTAGARGGVSAALTTVSPISWSIGLKSGSPSADVFAAQDGGVVWFGSFLIDNERPGDIKVKGGPSLTAFAKVPAGRALVVTSPEQIKVELSPVAGPPGDRGRAAGRHRELTAFCGA